MRQLPRAPSCRVIGARGRPWPAQLETRGTGRPGRVARRRHGGAVEATSQGDPPELPSRRAIREAELAKSGRRPRRRASGPTTRATSGRHAAPASHTWVTRVAVLGSLAAATIAVPLTTDGQSDEKSPFDLDVASSGPSTLALLRAGVDTPSTSRSIAAAPRAGGRGPRAPPPPRRRPRRRPRGGAPGGGGPPPPRGPAAGRRGAPGASRRPPPAAPRSAAPCPTATPTPRSRAPTAGSPTTPGATSGSRARSCAPTPPSR
jgi:hypothetical protein